MARILFIDDDPMTLITMSKAVEILGHQAISANSGRDALRLAPEQNPDLIFVDLRLADMDGLDVVRALQRQVSAIPVLVLSAGPEADAADQVRLAGAKSYVTKPVRLQTLQELIHTYAAGGGA